MTAKTLALVFGVVLVIVGVLGFISNPLVGATGFFLTNSLLNIAYIIAGIILAGCALRMPGQSGMWLKIIGVVYLIVAVLGFLLVPAGGAILGIFTTNMAGHWLHVVVGIVLLAAGFWGSNGMSSMPPQMPRAAM
jgi:hypothetical protein